MDADPSALLRDASILKAKRSRSLRILERKLRPIVRSARWLVVEQVLRLSNLVELAFYKNVMESAFLPNERIDVVPQLRILYVAVPKAASSRIRTNLAAMIGYDTVSNWRSDENWRVHSRRASRLQAPRHNVVDFHRMATHPTAFRFTFVRNPYARLLSLWADQYRDRPLQAGDDHVGCYLAYREQVSPTLPAGPDAALSFADFIRFCCATAEWRIERHWELQSTLVDIPGVRYELVGKTETFAADFGQVLDHVSANGALRERSMPLLNASSRQRTTAYFTPELANLVYQAYERDFDSFKYARAVPD